MMMLVFHQSGGGLVVVLGLMFYAVGARFPRPMSGWNVKQDFEDWWWFWGWYFLYLCEI